MSVPFRATPAAHARPWVKRLSATALVVIAPLLLTAACSAPAVPIAGPRPSEPSARTSPVGYRSTVAPYESQRPVEPGPWREQNERVSPGPRP